MLYGHQKAVFLKFFFTTIWNVTELYLDCLMLYLLQCVQA